MGAFTWTLPRCLLLTQHFLLVFKNQKELICFPQQFWNHPTHYVGSRRKGRKKVSILNMFVFLARKKSSLRIIFLDTLGGRWPVLSLQAAHVEPVGARQKARSFVLVLWRLSDTYLPLSPPLSCWIWPKLHWRVACTGMQEKQMVFWKHFSLGKRKRLQRMNSALTFVNWIGTSWPTVPKTNELVAGTFLWRKAFLWVLSFL